MLIKLCLINCAALMNRHWFGLFQILRIKTSKADLCSAFSPFNGPPVLNLLISSSMCYETGKHKQLKGVCSVCVCVSIRVHLSENLNLISLSYRRLIFFCLHLTTFWSNLSLWMVPQTVAHLSFATCFSIWLLYHFTFHFLSLSPPLSSSHSIVVATVEESRRLVGCSFIGFF